jgi:gliding motility-associated-like protein
MKSIFYIFAFFCFSLSAISQNTSSRYNVLEVEKSKDGFVRSFVDSNWIIYSSNGDLLTKQRFEQIRLFKFGMAAVQLNQKWGFIDTNGKLIVPCIYDLVVDFKDSITLVLIDNNWKKINRKGRLISSQLSGLDFTMFDLPNLNGSTFYFKRNDVNQNNLSGQVQLNNLSDVNIQTHDASQSSIPCPNNITFENGNFGNWSAFTGTTRCLSSRNNVALSSSGFINNRHTLIGKSSNLDPYGLFPITPQDGSNYCVKLGNAVNGAQAESISYNISVPQNATNYNITYRYAVVFQDPNHAFCEQPRFTARLVDPLTGESLPCGTFEHVSTSGIPGFFDSPVDRMVRCKPWARAFINLSPYAGRNLRLEFITVDCTRGGHWGYAYVDVDNNCSLTADVDYNCDPPNKTTLMGPPGFQEYKWWDNNFSTVLGTTEDLTFNPGKPLGTKLWVEVFPYAGLGCRDTLPVTIVANYPVANFEAPTPQCERGNSYTFKSTSFISKGSIALEIWNFGDGATASGSNVKHTYKLPGNYEVTLIAVGSNNCKDTIVKSITVLPSPVASFQVPAAQCLEGNSFTFSGKNSNGLATVINHFWDFGDGSISNNQNKTHAFPSAGKYNVKYVVSTADGCRDSIIQSVIIFPKPKANFPDLTPQCFLNNKFTFVSTSTSDPASNANLNWDFGNGLTASGANVSHSYSKEGSYLVTLTISAGSSSCSDKIQKQVVVNPQPDAVIQSDGPVIFCKGESVLLNVPKVVGHTYQWFLGGSAISGATQDTLRVNKEGVYTVNVQSVFGCKSSSAAPVTVLIPCEASIWLPDVFTPNGDGINDILMPVLPGIKKFRCFKIYNRWGQLIFESRDKSKGWDGTYLGKAQPIETYVWQIEGEDIAGKVYTKSGLFSLIR